MQADDTKCGSNSFMLRDGVCDEVANTKKCLYDGGDCCKEYKDKGLCRDCKCILDVDKDSLDKNFEALNILPVNKPEKLQALLDSANGWTVEVEEVISSKVCSILCLQHKKLDELNAWHYRVNERLCQCGWVHSASCPEQMVTSASTKGSFWTLDDAAAMNYTTAFIQMEKTVPCGRFNTRQLKYLLSIVSIHLSTDCLATGFRIVSNRSAEAMVEHGEVLPNAHSLWHCLEMCKTFEDCAWVSWRSPGGDNEEMQEETEESGK